tara:strand:+ start:2572 stop:2814 length:243 start_codon:yes stop_codon:yes gene_type:complete
MFSAGLIIVDGATFGLSRPLTYGSELIYKSFTKRPDIKPNNKPDGKPSNTGGDGCFIGSSEEPLPPEPLPSIFFEKDDYE